MRTTSLIRLSGTALLVTAFALGGCTTTAPLVMTQPVGPARGVRAQQAKDGELVVYSGWDRFDTLDPEHQKHTGYTVRSEAEGRTLHVRNRCGSFGESPDTVTLAPGKYVVETRATNVGPIHVPVVIHAGETTVLYLDGVTAPAASSQTETNWARQPNGTIVGWEEAPDPR